MKLYHMHIQPVIFIYNMKNRILYSLLYDVWEVGVINKGKVKIVKLDKRRFDKLRKFLKNNADYQYHTGHAEVWILGE